MNRILITISCILIILTGVSCKRNIFNPSIPNRTEFVEAPIANLSIPSKDATVKVTPVKTSISRDIVYGHFEHYFEFNGHYYLTAAYRYYYDANNQVIVDTLNGRVDGHILEIDVNDN
ncbi:hypothetical protein R4K90_13515, partial [Brachyspira murdochii]